MVGERGLEIARCGALDGWRRVAGCRAVEGIFGWVVGEMIGVGCGEGRGSWRGFKRDAKPCWGRRGARWTDG